MECGTVEKISVFKEVINSMGVMRTIAEFSEQNELIALNFSCKKLYHEIVPVVMMQK